MLLTTTKKRKSEECGMLQRNLRTAELDPVLLSTPFGVQTNWHVITGAQSSGKTTLIDQLADEGFQTVPEVARQYFEREKAKGRTMGLKCFHHRYASVFVLDRLSFQHDGLREEVDVSASFLDEWLARDYGALGYDVVRVPVLPPQERIAFVLETLSEHGLI
jgi:predicted ATPase